MPNAYTRTAKVFHWLIAVLIIIMLCVGLYMASLPLGPDKLKLIGLHKSTGITILFLVTLRLIWRLKHAVPPLPASLPKIYHKAAHAAHHSLYVLMFAMPLTGWAMSSAAGFPVSVFGFFTLPNIMPADKGLRVLFNDAHQWLAYLLIVMLIGHVAAALWHHFVHKDDVLRRMWFSSKTAS